MAQYGGSPPVYGESPEVVWELHLSDSARVSLWVRHEERSDIDLFLLERCDPMAILDAKTSSDTSSEHVNWFPLPPGRFYLVADAKDGKFFDTSLRLNYDRMTAPVAMPFVVYADSFRTADPVYLRDTYSPNPAVITVDDRWIDDQRGTCLRVRWRPTGIPADDYAHWYWETRTEGVNLERAHRVRFWLRGGTGQERVSFLIGGIRERHDGIRQAKCVQACDTFRALADWRFYDYPLTPIADSLSKVVGVFSFRIRPEDNPGPIEFFLDDIVYE